MQRRSRPACSSGKADAARGCERPGPRGPAGVVAAACLEEGTGENTGNPQRRPRVTADRRPARDASGPRRAAERPVVPTKPRNGGGGKGPWLKVSAGSGEGREIGDEPGNS